MGGTQLEAPSGKGRSVRLYVRAATTTPGQRASTIDRLENLVTEGAITSLDVESWPNAISVDIAERGSTAGLLDTFRVFETWAHRHGVIISPPFAKRIYHSTITGITDERLITPELALAVFEKGKLTAFYPYRDGDSTKTVQDALDELSDERALPPDELQTDSESGRSVR